MSVSVLETLDFRKVYVLGGLVDESIQKVVKIIYLCECVWGGAFKRLNFHLNRAN